jgi:hypothetical protein
MDSRQFNLYNTWDCGGRNSRHSSDLHIHGFLQYCLEWYSHGVSHEVQYERSSRATAYGNLRYTVEVMSYDIRSKLICTQNLLVQATITGFNYLNPVALQNITWKYVSMYSNVVTHASH